MPNHPAFQRTYRMTLEFTVWVNTEILDPYSDEDDLSGAERQNLAAQRALLTALLTTHQPVLEEMARKRVLDEADGAVTVYELAQQLLWRSLPDEELLEPVIEQLPEAQRQYFLAAIEEGHFTKAAEDVVYGIGVDLEDASLMEVEPSPEGRF